MGLTEGLTTIEATRLMLWYGLPIALVIAMAIVGGRWVRRHEGDFVGTEPGDGDREEHHEPPQ